MKWNIVHECDNDNGEPTEWNGSKNTMIQPCWSQEVDFMVTENGLE